MRTYSLYEMTNHSTLELVPLPIAFIEETESKSGFNSSRVEYQKCIQSGDWVSPFSRGCVKIYKELIPALIELEILKDEYFEATKDGVNLDGVSRTLLQSLGDCAYNFLEPNYIIRRGNLTMSKNGTAVLDQETEEKTKTRRGNTKMSELYGLIRQDEATGESLNSFEWYLSKQFGDIRVACRVLEAFNEHLNMSTFSIPGIDKELSADSKVQAMRALGVAEPAIEETLLADRVEATESFDLQKAIAYANEELKREQKAKSATK